MSSFVRLPLLFALLAGSVASRPALAQQDVSLAGKTPFFLTLQVGGGAGMVAVGGGVRLARQKLEPELLVGWVPARFSGQPLTVFTFKTTYLPIHPTFGAHWRASGGVGGYVNYTTGATLRNSQDPDTYQRGYYWFSTKVRTGFFLTPRLTYGYRRTPQRPAPLRLSAYAELGTNDLYLLSRFSNKGALSFIEILTLGFGSKIN